MIACAPTREFFKDRPFIFRLWTDAEQMSPILVDELLKQGRKEIGLVFSEHPAMSDFAEYFRKYAESHGIKFGLIVESSG
jgi:DNA-binding LacI/PurR family transcriptional regulator